MRRGWRWFAAGVVVLLGLAAWGIWIDGWFFDSDEWGTVGEWVAGIGALAAVVVALHTARDATVSAERATEALALELKPDFHVQFQFMAPKAVGDWKIGIRLTATNHAGRDVEVSVLAVGGVELARDRHPIVSKGSDVLLPFAKMNHAEFDQEVARCVAETAVPMLAERRSFDEMMAQLTENVQSVDVSFSDERQLMRWRRKYASPGMTDMTWTLVRQGPDILVSQSLQRRAQPPDH